MKRIWKPAALAAIVVTGLITMFSSKIARGDDYTPVTISQLEEVNAEDGSSHWVDLHPTTSLYPVQFMGVVINNPSDMLNYNYNAVSNPSPEFQVYVQALSSGGTYSGYTVAPGDFGGAAAYMRMKIPWNFSQNYTEEEWAAELTRIGASSLGAGDVVLVQAKAPGMDYNGKYNINEQHKKSSDYDFSITVLGQTTCAASPIDLSVLKDSSDNFIFDPTRAAGCERYQGSLVELDNLLLTDPGNWTSGGTVTVSQGDRTFPMKIGLDPDLLSFNPYSLTYQPFSVTAILDQESADYQAGYRLWLTDASCLSVPEPGSLALLGTAIMASILFGRRRIAGIFARWISC